MLPIALRPDHDTRRIGRRLRTARRSTLVLLAAACLAAPELAAQRIAVDSGTLGPVVYGRRGTVVTDSRTRDWDKGYGDGSFGGSVGADANATRTYVSFSPLVFSSSNYKTSAGLSADVLVFGSTYPDAARFGVSAENEPYNLSSSGATAKVGYKPSTTVFMSLAGNNVWSESSTSFAGTPLSKTWSHTFGPRDTTRIDYYFSLGPVPLKASAWAGASATASFTASANLGSVTLDLTGHAEGAIYGVAQLGVTFGPATVGIAGELSFGNPEIDAGLSAGIFSGVAGYLDACVTPVKFVLQVFAELGWGKFMKRWTRDLHTWSSAQFCQHFTL